MNALWRIAATAILVIMPLPGLAQQNDGIEVQLNRVTDLDPQSCEVVFLGSNATGNRLVDVSYRVIILSDAGIYDGSISIPLGPLADGRRTLIRHVLDMPCDSLGQLVVLSAATCEIEGVPTPDCDALLRPVSLSDLPFGY